MKKYKLTIEEFSPNPAYEEELKTWNDKNRYNPQYADLSSGPLREIVTKVLLTEVNEVEFHAIKAAALLAMGDGR